jgi:uncharacterized membrane protein
MEKKETIKSVTYVIAGALLQMFNGIGGGWASSLTAIFGLVLFFIGLKKLKDGMDEAGQGAVKLLIIAAIMGVVGLVFDLIPLLGLISSIIFIAAFIVELIGFIKLKTSASIGEAGKGGVTLLIVAMTLAIVQSIFGLLPFVGGIIGSILSIVAIILVFFGWLKIQEGIIDNIK